MCNGDTGSASSDNHGSCFRVSPHRWARCKPSLGAGSLQGIVPSWLYFVSVFPHWCHCDTWLGGSAPDRDVSVQTGTRLPLSLRCGHVSLWFSLSNGAENLNSGFPAFFPISWLRKVTFEGEEVLLLLCLLEISALGFLHCSSQPISAPSLLGNDSHPFPPMLRCCRWGQQQKRGKRQS